MTKLFFFLMNLLICEQVRRVWRYQNGNRRRTYNTMAKVKGQTTIYKTLHIKLKIE